MQTINFKEWIELQEGLGSFMLPMMLGATTASQAPDAMIQKPNVEKQLLNVIKQQEKEQEARSINPNNVATLVSYAQNTKDALDNLEDNLSGAINYGKIKVDHTDDNYLKIHHYFDELRTRLDTFVAKDNFDYLVQAFGKHDLNYVTGWMRQINDLNEKFLTDPQQTYELFMKDYPKILNQAELRASWIRGSHPEDSGEEFERYKKQIEAEIQGKRKR